MRVAVVGGGILGASVAWHLGQGGAAVTVFAGPEAGATEGSFGWVNASWGNDAAYRRLRMASMARWPDLAAQVPGTGFRRCGGLLWDLPEAELRAYADEAAVQGYDVRLIGADEARLREPVLRRAPALAVLAPGEGMVEPGAARALLAASGAQVVPQAVALDLVGGRVVVRGVSERFDAVVITAGIDSPDLLEQVGLEIDMEAPDGLLAWTEPVAPCLTGLLLTPEFHLRQTPEGQLVLGEDFGGGEGEEDPDFAAAILLGMAEAALKLPPLRLARTTIAARPTPGDGHPAVGALPVPGLYLALSHSGMTLAPVLGAMLAAEILTGAVDPLIAPYAPGRLVQSA